MTDQGDKYNDIIAKAYGVFIQHGIKNISMDDLCRMMGISKKTIYKYVENKVDLLMKISNYVQEQIAIRIEELQKSNLNAIDVLLEMSKASTKSHIRINPMVNFEIRKYYPQVYDAYINKKKELIIQSIIKNLEKGINEGLYRQDLTKEIVAHLYFKKIEEFHTLEGDNLRNFSYSNIFEVMFENHIRGISNENGIKYFEQQKAKLNFNL
ncbi:MAG: TetR/AcrR family transcriptional regulator [Bacteroidales bacterium]|nr:TetR/AcrR family transcriptional regulator [Bacteroidales bacterium]MCF8403626.1 TetR/AcrR family transcriptional regulator [Bacteroidales bacterium]